MAKANDVADFLISLGCSEVEPNYLTHLQLQKLLYYVQGWSLALRDKPLFGERIEAWAHGPVVPSIYPRFAQFGNFPITCQSITTEDGFVGQAGELDESEINHVLSVWEVYRQYSAAHLWKMTHSEQPWIDARRGLGPADRGQQEITKDSMQKFFLQLAAE